MVSHQNTRTDQLSSFRRFAKQLVNGRAARACYGVPVVTIVSDQPSEEVLKRKNTWFIGVNGHDTCPGSFWTFCNKHDVATQNNVIRSRMISDWNIGDAPKPVWSVIYSYSGRSVTLSSPIGFEVLIF
jgi:hypothetical protein